MTTTLDTHTHDHLRDRTAGISLTGLAKTFLGPQGPVRAVRGVDLDIAPGETVALLGPNGAGKTTTIDMMLGLLRPTPARCRSSERSRRQAVEAGAMGAMLQTGQLIRDLTVREIVAVMASLYPDPLPVDDVLEMTGLAPLARRRTQKLSGGESQRVRFALALVADPDLMVLDEPTVAMDVEARRSFWATMRCVRVPRHDGGVRDPLPGGGRRVRRPDRADGARPGGGRRPGDRDQGAGRACTRSGPRCPTSSRPPSRRCRA